MKKIWIVILSFAMLFVSGMALTNPIFNVYAEEENSGGTQVTDVTVKTAAELIAALAKQEPNVHIKLEDDIKGEAIYDDEDPEKIVGYKPVEIDVSLLNEFTGIFDGQGHTISDLVLTSNNETSNFALIPTAKNAVIKNVKLDGTLTYDLTNLSANGGIIGGLVGIGEGVTIENCEVNVTAIAGLSLDKQTTFGGIVGKLEGAASTIENCITYFSCQTSLSDIKQVAVGGLVGTMNQSAVYNSISNANIVVSLNPGVESQQGITQYYGGIVGKLIGTNAQVRNCLYGGNLNVYSSQSCYKGAIIGGCPESYMENNVRNDYFIQSDPYIAPVGDATIAIRANLQKLSNVNENYTAINQTVLSDKSLFDVALNAWNFDQIWDTRNGQIVLQKFQTFKFEIATNFENKITSDAILTAAVLDDKAGNVTKKDYAYDAPVTIYIQINNECNGWFEDLIVYRGTDLEQVGYLSDSDVVKDGTYYGWEFTTKANASTAGIYSFSLGNEITYDLEISTEDMAKGGVKLQDATDYTDKIPLTFSYSYKEETIEANANGIYAFGGWKLEKWVEPEGEGEEGSWVDAPIEISTNAVNVKIGAVEGSGYMVANIGTGENVKKVLTLDHGSKFRLLTTYSANPMNANFTYDDNILNISFNEVDYVGESIGVPKNGTIILKVTVKKGYALDEVALEKEIINLCTKNAAEGIYEIPHSFRYDPTQDEEGNTIYTFNVDVKAIKNGAEEERSEFELRLKTVVAEKGASGDLLWLWITIGCAGAIAIAIIILVVILRNRKYGRGGGKSNKSSSKTPTKTKSASYKDYFI